MNALPSTAQSIPRLLQFQRSHYNEKARWAFDYKRIPHTRATFLPGPHARPVRKLTGATQVPVVIFDDEVVAGSAGIINALEHRFPEPALYPDSATDRARALEIQRYFDDEVGVAVRTAIFSEMIREPGYFCSVFSSERSAPVRLAYRAMFPIARKVVSKAMGLDDADTVAKAFAVTEQALDFVAREVGTRGYLVADRFTVADLTCAALLALTADPDHPQMRRPRPQPPRLQAWHRRWQGHPATAWVHERYRCDRPDSAAV